MLSIQNAHPILYEFSFSSFIITFHLGIYDVITSSVRFIYIFLNTQLRPNCSVLLAKTNEFQQHIKKRR